MYYYIKVIGVEAYLTYNKDLAFWYVTSKQENATLITSEIVAREQLKMIARELNFYEAQLCVETFKEDEE